MYEENTTQISTDKQDDRALRSAEFEKADPDENERQLAGNEMTESDPSWNQGDDPFDEESLEQHIQFPISFADWGPRNSLL